MKHYDVLTPEDKKTWDLMTENPSYEPSREEKLSSFKIEKNIREQLKVRA